MRSRDKDAGLNRERSGPNSPANQRRHRHVRHHRRGGTGPLPLRYDHEGATEEQVGDRTGPGVGYDFEERDNKDESGPH